MPEEHLGPCHTCDRNGRNCRQEKEAGEGVEGVDFVLYVSALQTRQCGETVGELQTLFLIIYFVLIPTLHMKCGRTRQIFVYKFYSTDIHEKLKLNLLQAQCKAWKKLFCLLLGLGEKKPCDFGKFFIVELEFKQAAVQYGIVAHAACAATHTVFCKNTEILCIKS